MISKNALKIANKIVSYPNSLRIGLIAAKPTDSEGFQIDDNSLFIPSKQFVSSIQKVLLNHVHECPVMQSYGLNQKVGYLNINDQRCGNVWGRVNDPSDILGACLLDNGKIVPRSFERNLTHILYSRKDGLVTLTEYLHRKLLAELVKHQGE